MDSIMSNRNERSKRNGTGMVSRALLKEAVDILPTLPDTNNILEIGEFIQENLPFNALSTRRRYRQYIITWLFPQGVVDREIEEFAKIFPNTQDLRDVCLYRFCCAYPLIFDIFHDIFIPKIGYGKVPRKLVHEYLKNLFPDHSPGRDGGRGFLEALTGAQVMKSKGGILTYHYREVSIPALAFILHSEFPKPGMYDISKVEDSTVFQPLLWQPDGILSGLYTLRNRNLIAKVSVIDTVRQFTTKYSLNEVIEKLKNLG